MNWVSYKDLIDDELLWIKKLTKKEFGSSDFQKRYEPATPDNTLIFRIDGDAIGYIHAIVRKGKVNNQDSKIGGLMNLVILDKFRGQGYGKKLFIEGLNFLFEKQDADFFVGFPDKEELFLYYERLGCKTIKAKFIAESKDGIKESNSKAIYAENPQRSFISNIQTVDFCGRPW